MIKAIIVDDENAAIKSLQWEIENFCKDISVVDTFTNPIDAISAINCIKPDCVFLDIEMPEMDGFQLLEKLNYRDFDLIITTAYDSYALKAFKENAIDYLLKPVDTDDLIKSISKIKTNKNKNTLGNELKDLLNNLPKNNLVCKIPLSLTGKTIFVKPDDILYCKSEGNYTEIHFISNKKELISKKIKDIEILINNLNFYRVHNSYLVNINYIKEFVKTDGQYIILDNNVSIPVSRTKKNDLLKLLIN
jgi:two-component system LytT family response regulator